MHHQTTVFQSKCSLKSKSPTSFPTQKGFWPAWLKNQSRLIFYYRALSKFSAVGTGGSSSPLESVPPEKMCNSMRGSLIKKQVKSISLFSPASLNQKFGLSAGCQSQWCLSPFPFSFLLARQFLCLFWVKADERERCYHLATLSKFNRSLPLHCHILCWWPDGFSYPLPSVHSKQFLIASIQIDLIRGHPKMITPTRGRRELQKLS